MKNFKDWLDGKNDIFNEDIDPIDQTKRVEGVDYIDQDEDEEEGHISTKGRIALVRKEVRFVYLLYIVLSIITCVIYFGSLMFLINNLEPFGTVNTPYNYVAKYYIEFGLSQTKSVNAVTGMILDYRAFDTLGESFVLFTAVTCVFVLLQGMESDPKLPLPKNVYGIHHDPIVRYVATIIIPLIFVYGVYVVLNGHLSPGGGFSGGAIIGAGLILYSLAFGPKAASKFFKQRTFKTVSALALSGYAITKCYSFFMGGMHVLFPDNYEDPIAEWFHHFADGSIISGGYILILNICVGAVVACTMYGFYCLFKKGEI